MEGLIEIITNVWKEGFLGIGITEIIVSLLIFIAGAISRAFFVGRVLKWLENLTSQTDSEIDDVLLQSLKKPLGYIPMTDRSLLRRCISPSYRHGRHLLQLT
jgi:MscS family membrane protein